MSLAELRGDIVILACAVSAGIHGALVPDHFDEGTGAGLSFVAAALVLTALVVWLTRQPASALAFAAAAAVLAALLAGYALATTTGVPVLHPEAEPLDPLALATKAIEAVGLLAAASLLRRPQTPDPPTTERNTDMDTTRASRPIPIALTALVAFFSALTALAVSNGHVAHAHATVDHSAAIVTRAELTLRSDMRQLWEDHIVWTRLAIISLTTDSPDTDATVGRLLENQTDIGDAVKPFYGESAGNELTRQLRLHILIAADVIAAARAGEQAQLADAQARWESNADDIAAVLNSVNPKYWDLATMKAEMHKHLDLTTQEAVARLQGNWTADVAAYDEIHDHILHMSDILATGIVEQFPKRFH